MRMLRVELSIRQFPLSSSLLHSPLTVSPSTRQNWEDTSAVFPPSGSFSADLVDCCTCLCPGLSFSRCNRSCLQTPACSPFSPWERQVGWVSQMRPRTRMLSHNTAWESGTCKRLGAERGVAGRGFWSGRGVGSLGLRAEWLCRLLVLWLCCVSLRHSPASPRHEPRRKGVLLHAQLLRKSAGLYFPFYFLCD